MHNPEEYLENNGAQRRDAEITLKRWNSFIKWQPNEVILDVGCGPGDLTSSLLDSFFPRGVKVVGSDLAEEMIAYAKKTFAKNQLTFRLLDISSPNIWNEWQEKQFDKIFSFYCLHWVVDQRQAAINMNNLLKDNGTVNLMFIDYHPLNAWYYICKSMPKWAPYLKDFNMWEGYSRKEDFEKEYENLLTCCGFEVTSNNVRETTHEFDSVQAYHDVLESINAFKGKMSKEIVKEFVDESFKGQLERQQLTKRKDGSVVQHHTLIEVIAKKVRHMK